MTPCKSRISYAWHCQRETDPYFGFGAWRGMATTATDQWGSLISLKSPFDPTFGSSPLPGLIKRANAVHLRQKSPSTRRGRNEPGAELDKPRQTSNLPVETGDARRTSVGAEREVPQVCVTKRGVKHCCCKPGLLHFNITH